MAASERRKRARTPVGREDLGHLIDAMEMPLARVAYLVRALEYVGFGMHAHEEDGADPVLGIAMAMSHDLEVVQTAWERMTKVL